MVGGASFPIETFDEVLRDLLTCGLVVRDDAEDTQSWHLVGQAQERLEALAIAVGPWPAERTTYSHHQCADCRRRKLIWVRRDSSLCDSCWQKGFATTPATPMSARSTPRFPTGQLVISNELSVPWVGEPIEELGHRLEQSAGSR